MKRRKKRNPLEIKANKLWIDKCLEMWGNICTGCGCSANTFHHFIPKSISNNLRYDVYNGVPICNRCHYIIHFSHDTLKRRALEEAIISKRGDEWLEYIKTEKPKRINKNKMWLEEQIQALERIL